MAAAWFRHLCELRKLSFVQVRSAGTAAADAAPMSEHVRTVLARENVPAGPHRSRFLTPDMVRDSDLIFGMTNAHRRTILHDCPEAHRKVQTLLSLAGMPDRDIADPIGGSVADYAHCLEMMKPALTALADRIAAEHGADVQTDAG